MSSTGHLELKELYQYAKITSRVAGCTLCVYVHISFSNELICSSFGLKLKTLIFLSVKSVAYSLTTRTILQEVVKEK